MTEDTTRVTVAILGAGIAGICMAASLERAGIRSFLIVEKAGGIGGTWRENTYPGAGCDVPSHLYCFSFAPNAEWSRKFAEQPEILAYLRRFADAHALGDRLWLNTQLVSARFLASDGVWELVTASGKRIVANVFVSGSGQLNRPLIPDLPGLGEFAGTTFHSARWQHDFPLRDKRVAVIGNGASAIQFVPRIAPELKKLTIYQRSAHWIIPKRDRAYHRLERWLFRQLPATARLHRYGLYWRLEGRFLAFAHEGVVNKLLELLARRELDRVEDRTLRAKLTPSYTIGCKRVLISNDYYEAVARANVEVVTERITRITEDGIVRESGVHDPVDAIVLATGFETQHLLATMNVTGLGGKSLSEAWRAGAEAYLGMTVPGFPNLFLLYGPNTNLGHNSIIFMIECQTRYVVACVKALSENGYRWLDVRREVADAYNAWLRKLLDTTVWSSDCTSWYKDATGKITNNWASFAARYWWLTRRPDFSAFGESRTASNPAPVAE